MNIQYNHNKTIAEKDIKGLYQDAGWSAYTKNLKSLMDGIQNSLLVISAWKDTELVGLIRLIGDGQTIVYVQDILVKQAFKRKGIGKSLLEKSLNAYPSVRQTVLLTDDNPETRGFYEAMGFESCDKGTLVAYVKMRT